MERRIAAPEHTDEFPWYRQFWPWFLIFLPASAVIASFATLFIALNNPDPLVRDDWYEHGANINRTLRDGQEPPPGIGRAGLPR